MTARNRALLDGQRVLEEAARASAEKEKNAREALESQLEGERAVVDRLLSDQERLATENEELRSRVLGLQQEVFSAREAANAATAARDARAREAADLRLRLQETQIKLNEVSLAGRGVPANANSSSSGLKEGKHEKESTAEETQPQREAAQTLTQDVQGD